MIIALYKAQDHLFNKAASWWTKGPYSHTELIFSNGMSGSSSFRDDGVRVKKIAYKPEKWDFIVLPRDLFDDAQARNWLIKSHAIKLLWYDEDKAREWFANHAGEKYDNMGIVGHVWPPTPDTKDKRVCSEAVLAALGYTDAWRFDPNDMPSLLKMPVIRGCDFDFEKYGVPKYAE